MKLQPALEELPGEHIWTAYEYGEMVYGAGTTEEEAIENVKRMLRRRRAKAKGRRLVLANEVTGESKEVTL